MKNSRNFFKKLTEYTTLYMIRIYIQQNVKYKYLSERVI